MLNLGRRRLLSFLTWELDVLFSQTLFALLVFLPFAWLRAFEARPFFIRIILWAEPWCSLRVDINIHNAVRKEKELYPEAGVGHSSSLDVVKADLLIALGCSERLLRPKWRSHLHCHTAHLNALIITRLNLTTAIQSTIFTVIPVFFVW